MRVSNLSTLYSSEARLVGHDFLERRELKGAELFPLFRRQADVVGPIAVGWGYSPLLVEKTTWSRTVTAAREVRTQLVRSWNPGTATLKDALRLAFLVGTSVSSAVEPFALLWDTIHPDLPRAGMELDDATELLAEAQHEAGPQLFDSCWMRLCIAESSFCPELLPAAIVASWVAIHRPDLIGLIENKASERTDFEWEEADPGFEMEGK